MESRAYEAAKHPIVGRQHNYPPRLSRSTNMVNIVTGESVGTLGELLARGQEVADKWKAQQAAGYGAYEHEDDPAETLAGEPVVAAEARHVGALAIDGVELAVETVVGELVEAPAPVKVPVS